MGKSVGDDVFKLNMRAFVKAYSNGSLGDVPGHTFLMTLGCRLTAPFPLRVGSGMREVFLDMSVCI